MFQCLHAFWHEQDCSWYYECSWPLHTQFAATYSTLQVRSTPTLSRIFLDATSAPRSGVGYSGRVWLAMGMIVDGRVTLPEFRRRSGLVDRAWAGEPGGTRPMVWRHVAAAQPSRRQARAPPRETTVVVPCADGPAVERVHRSHRTLTRLQQWSCFCKTAHWFAFAVELFPRVRSLVHERARARARVRGHRHGRGHARACT